MKTQKNYLDLAKQKYEESNDVDFNLGLIEFLCDCYTRLKPCSYGSRIQAKIIKNLNLISLSPSLNIGDVAIGKKNGEIKSSFLDKKKCYNCQYLSERCNALHQKLQEVSNIKNIHDSMT